MKGHAEPVEERTGWWGRRGRLRCWCMLCFLHVTYMMEEGLLKDLELVENELLVVRTQLDNLLQVRDLHFK